MKKLAYIVLAAALVLSACTMVEPEVLPGRKISFTVGTYAVRTKADTVALSGVTDNFRSRAFLHAAGVAGTQDFFGTGAGEKVAWDYVSTWAPGAETNYEYFWPMSSESYINFVCWYDNNGAPKLSGSGEVSESNLVWESRTVGSSDIILYADEAWRYNDNDHSKFRVEAADGVPVLFHHALAQLCFKAKIKDGCASSGTTSWTIDIDNASLSNVYSTGTLSLSNSDPGSENTTCEWTGSWVPEAPAASLALSGVSNLGTTATDILALRSILPQAVSNSMILSFRWKLSTYENNDPTPVSVEYIQFSQSLRSLVPSITEWGMGQRITYTLVIDPRADSILIAPTLQNWAEDSGGIVVE